jgi:hypothetical protein
LPNLGEQVSHSSSSSSMVSGTASAKDK